MKKKYLLIGLMIMAVGFAAVTTTLLINGSSKISSNDADFKVYYSNALVNGTQDLSVVVDETHLSFTTTLDTIGQSYVLDYDVTNGSKNYDADVEMVCTGGNDYLRVTNEFDDESKLIARQTRSGKLTLEMIKSNVGDDIDVNIECTIRANAVERDSIKDGEANPPVEPLPVIAMGNEIVIEGERFNIIKVDDDSVSLFAKHNVNEYYKQSETSRETIFSTECGWDYLTGPVDVDIQLYEGNAKNFVNGYVDFLQRKLNFTSISGNLITLTELKGLGCTINDDYSSGSGLTCKNSEYADWLINGQTWWTRSVKTGQQSGLWYVNETGNFDWMYFNYFYGIRPVITIDKAFLESYLVNGVPLNAQSFCESKGYSYGYLKPTTYGAYQESGNLDDAYYLCSNLEDFEKEYYGFDIAGNLVYSFYDFGF